jgi:hypothetical protein
MMYVRSRLGDMADDDITFLCSGWCDTWQYGRKERWVDVKRQTQKSLIKKLIIVVCIPNRVIAAHGHA